MRGPRQLEEERGTGQHAAGPDRSTGPVGADYPGPDEPTLLLKITPRHLERYQRAASSQGLPVDAWAVQALDRATLHSLTTLCSAELPIQLKLGLPGQAGRSGRHRQPAQGQHSGRSQPVR